MFFFKKLKLLILNFRLKKKYFCLFYLKKIYIIFFNSNSIIYKFFQFFESKFSNKFDSKNMRLDLGLYNIKEIARISGYLLNSIITYSILSLLNFIQILIIVIIDFLLNGFFIYKNIFLKNLFSGLIKIFLITNLFYFLPVRYNVLIILYYTSFYLGIIFILLLKKQNKECFEFIGWLFIKQRKNIVFQNNFNFQIKYYITEQFQKKIKKLNIQIEHLVQQKTALEKELKK